MLDACDAALAWLLPLTSFPSRYLVVSLQDWTLVLQNGRSTAPDDLLLPISKITGSLGVFGRWSDRGRILEVVDGGSVIRAVRCYPDGGRWVFHQVGTPLPYEESSSYTRRRKKDRLTGDDVQQILTKMLGADIPPAWRDLMAKEKLRPALQPAVALDEGGARELSAARAASGRLRRHRARRAPPRRRSDRP